MPWPRLWHRMGRFGGAAPCADSCYPIGHVQKVRFCNGFPGRSENRLFPLRQLTIVAQLRTIGRCARPQTSRPTGDVLENKGKGNENRLVQMWRIYECETIGLKIAPIRGSDHACVNLKLTQSRRFSLLLASPFALFKSQPNWGAMSANRPRGRPHTNVTRKRGRGVAVIVPVENDQLWQSVRPASFGAWCCLSEPRFRPSPSNWKRRVRAALGPSTASRTVDQIFSRVCGMAGVSAGKRRVRDDQFQ